MTRHHRARSRPRHHLSVVYELRRFIRCLHETRADDPASVCRARDSYLYVWGFSWGALHMVEGTLFIPWLRDQLPARYRPELRQLERDLSDLWSHGERIGRDLRAGESPGALRPASLESARRHAERLEARAVRVYAGTERSLVPCVAAHVSRREQERFNSRVLSRLGLIPSRLHLVGFAEAIAGNAAERRLFREQVPAVARMMLPRWKRALYEPRTACLRGESLTAGARGRGGPRTNEE